VQEHSSDKQIQVLTYKAKDGLWFNSVKIIRQNYHEFYDFSTNAKFTYNGDGASAFQESLAFYTNPNTVVFVVFASAKQYSGDLSTIGVEMYITATTSTNAVFGSHMGIQRIETLHPHPKISMDLHKFAACVITTANPNAVYMMTSPLPTMAVLMIKDLYNIGAHKALMLDCPWISDPALQELKEHIATVDTSNPAWEKQVSGWMLARYYFEKHLREIQGKTEVIKCCVDRIEIILPNGFSASIKLKQRNEEFAYYYKHLAHAADTYGNDDYKPLIIDYKVLASRGTEPFPLTLFFLSKGVLVPADIDDVRIVDINPNYHVDKVEAASEETVVNPETAPTVELGAVAYAELDFVGGVDTSSS